MLVGTENSETSNFPPRKLWTRAECEVMERLGIVDLERHDLIGGAVEGQVGEAKSEYAGCVPAGELAAEYLWRAFRILSSIPAKEGSNGLARRRLSIVPEEYSPIWHQECVSELLMNPRKTDSVAAGVGESS